MSIAVDRRMLLRAGVLGAAALSTPGFAQAMRARGFSHGVASGEPSAESVLLWTRYVARDESKLRCEVSEDESFAKIVSGGEVIASPARDYCSKLVIHGLEPGRHYWYRFIAPNGDKSVVGRTKTLPVGDIDKFKLGVFSCANIGFGWFNCYGHAAMHDEIDLMVHLGDYIYEYVKGVYPEQPIAGRKIEPANEAVTLADYRIRYASYRMDPELQKLHQNFPMIAQWDDHEFANDTYKDGAQNHQPDKEGPWTARRSAAAKAYFEWMPVSEDGWSSYEIGSLASLFRLETRLLNRTKSFHLSQVMKGQGDPQAALRAFRDGGWWDPKQTLMGEAQEQWLYRGMKRSVSAGKRWQILAQQIVMGTVKAPTEMSEFAKRAGSPWMKDTMNAIAATAGTGMPFNMDAWDGFPAARERLFKASLEANCNLVVLAGDSHNAWGNNLTYNGTPVGVEYAGTSVASPGFEWYLPQTHPSDLERAFRDANPDLMFTDLSQRGYMVIELTPEQVTGEWLFLDTLSQRNLTPLSNKRLSVKRSHNRFSLA